MHPPDASRVMSGPPATGSLRKQTRPKEPTVKVFACGELVPGCETVFQGESEEEILEQVAVHARGDHGMHDVPEEVVDRIRSRITERADV